MNLTNKRILITGGSGFLGKPLVEKLLSDGNFIRVISRDEGQLISLKEAYPEVEIYTREKWQTQ